MPPVRLHRMNGTTVTLTYAPDADVERSELDHLVQLARGLHRFDGAPLYDSVELAASMVVFRIALDPQPIYGAGSVATGLAGRAIAASGLTSRLRQRDCAIA